MGGIEQDVSIKSPQDLIGVLQHVRQAIAEGRLQQIKPNDAPMALDDITTVSHTGPWPDYIEAYFKVLDTGAIFKLSVETYHGAGGEWRQVSSQ